MNSIILYVFTAIGLILGYSIPYFSDKIIEYKNKDNLNKNIFLYSKLFKFALCIFNTVMWYMSAISMDNQFVALLISIMITTGLIIAFIDINIRIIPNEIVIFIIVIGALFQVLYFGPKALILAAVSMVVMMVIFTSVAGFVGFGKVGAGDVKLAGAMGLSLGFPIIITAVLAMAVSLLVFIGLGLLFKKIYLSTMLPFAPFMIVGYIFALITLL